MSATPERPLADVLVTTWHDFCPTRPNRRPWHQPGTIQNIEFADTSNRALVPLAVADRATVRNLEWPGTQDDLEPTDWMAVGWVVAPEP